MLGPCGAALVRCRPVSVLLDLWVHDVEALVGERLDPLRWRPNLYVEASPGFSAREPELVGATLRAGSVELQVVDTIERCVTPTYDVATGEPLPPVLERVARDRSNVVGSIATCSRPEKVALGDIITSP